VSAVVGFVEADGERIYNTAALLEPGVSPRFYRKSHLPELGVDKFVDRGDALDVFDTRHGRVGIHICYDLRFPEPSRVLTLDGAEIIVLPTNWPEGAEASAEHVAIARAAENRVFMVTCNRVGEENGFRFIGRSKIVGPAGDVLAAAGSGSEVLIADIDPSQARIKRNVRIPGRYETEVIESRRPELYGAICR
jgi:predicted amidohydrolase